MPHSDDHTGLHVILDEMSRRV